MGLVFITLGSNYFYVAAFSVVLGLIPSLIWLFYYLKKDCNPEPKSMIAKTMIIAAILAPVALLLQELFKQTITHFSPSFYALGSPVFLFWAALVEEFAKFWAVKTVVLNNPNFDEPTDGMIYMISAALGFAALENMVLLFNFQANPLTSFFDVYKVLLLRFGGATLLHALASALIGYALAIAWFYREHSKKIISLGIILATVFHFTFNSILLRGQSSYSLMSFVYPALLMIVMATLVYFLFTRLKKKMVCYTH